MEERKYHKEFLETFPFPFSKVGFVPPGSGDVSLWAGYITPFFLPVLYKLHTVYLTENAKNNKSSNSFEPQCVHQ